MNGFEPAVGRWWAAGHLDSAVSGVISARAGTFGQWKLATDGELAAPGPPGFDTYRNIHGVTPEGEMTLRHASNSRETRRSGAVTSQTWHGQELISGGHVVDQDRFRSAQFRLPHLLSWFGPSELNMRTSERFRVSPEDCGPPLEARLDEGVSVMLGAAVTEVIGHAAGRWAARGVYTLNSRHGMTIDDVHRIGRGLSHLHSTLTSLPISPYSITINQHNDPHVRPLQIVDPERRDEPADGDGEFHDPFFDTSEIEFEPFIRAWLALCDGPTMAVTVALPTPTSQWVETRLMDICNGLESLAAHQLEQPPLGEDALRVLEVLRENGFNSKVRQRVKSGLQMQRWPLADKLAQLAVSIGPESAEWLLGPSIAAWATLVARLRNSVAHGRPIPGGLSGDPIFPIMAMRSAEAVLRLSLLTSAGFANSCPEMQGEVLWVNGSRATAHPNSSLFRDLEDVAHYASHWAEWHQRLLTTEAEAEPK